MLLSGVDCCPGGAVYDDLRPHLSNGVLDGLAVGQVEVGPREGDDITTGECVDQVTCQETARARDQPATHGWSAARALRGSHHDRFSRYHFTVSARPRSKLTAGR